MPGSKGRKLCTLQIAGCCIGSSAHAASKLKASGRKRISYTEEGGWRCGPCLDRTQTDQQPAAPKRKAPPAQAGPFERTPQLRGGSGRKRVTEAEHIVDDFHAGSTPPPQTQRRGGKDSSPKKTRKKRVAGVRGRAGPHGPLRGVNFSQGRSPRATGQTKTDAAAFDGAAARGPYLTASKYTSKEAAIEDLRNMSAAFKRLVKTSELQAGKIARLKRSKKEARAEVAATSKRFEALESSAAVRADGVLKRAGQPEVLGLLGTALLNGNLSPVGIPWLKVQATAVSGGQSHATGTSRSVHPRHLHALEQQVISTSPQALADASRE